jgi:hypothetical protein
MVRSEFTHEVIEEETYWFSSSSFKKSMHKALLLPCYDEYTVGYTDRSAIYDTSHNTKLDARGSFIAQYTILVHGRVVGTWKRTLKKNLVAMEAVLFREVKKSEMHAIIQAAERYANFLELSFSLDFAEAG